MPIYFQLNQPNLPLAIESIGNDWPQESVQRRNGYPHFHWLQTTAGAGEIRLQNQTIGLSEGQGILLAPFTPHAYSPKQSWQTSFLTFNGRLDEYIPAIVGNQAYYLARDSDQFCFSEQIDHWITDHLSKKTDELQVSIDCYAFLTHISYRDEQRTNVSDPLYVRYVLPVLQEIETNYATELTVAALAKTCFVSPQYLTRLFQRFLNMSTYQYLQQYRINKAKALLVNKKELEIQQVGFLVGLNDPSHFTAQFKQTTGYTPRAFRRLHG